MRATDGALVRLLLVLILLAGCGTFGRKTATLQELGLGGLDEQRLAELRGRDPLVAETWLLSAIGAETPDQALEIVESALRLHPRNENLALARLQLLGDLGRHDDFVTAVRQRLGVGQSPMMQAVMRSYLVQGLLRSGDPDGAWDECFRLGAVPDTDPALTSRGFMSVALDLEFLGRSADADDAFNQSLDQGPGGIDYLRDLAATRPERRAAAEALVERGLQRHARHVDLHVSRVIGSMRAGDLDQAELRLAALPGPVPFRIQGQVEMLEAQILLLREIPEDAMPIVLDRLDRFVADADALETLLASWERFGQPSDDEVRRRLLAARRHLTVRPLLARRVALALERLGPAKVDPKR